LVNILDLSWPFLTILSLQGRVTNGLLPINTKKMLSEIIRTHVASNPMLINCVRTFLVNITADTQQMMIWNLLQTRVANENWPELARVEYKKIQDIRESVVTAIKGASVLVAISDRLPDDKRAQLKAFLSNFKSGIFEPAVDCMMLWKGIKNIVGNALFPVAGAIQHYPTTADVQNRIFAAIKNNTPVNIPGAEYLDAFVADVNSAINHVIAFNWRVHHSYYHTLVNEIIEEYPLININNN